jgi:hypothetical protein
MTDRSRYFNPSKNYWFSFNAFLISLIGLYFRCLSFPLVLVNTACSDGAFPFVLWFIHWKRMIRPFLFIDKQKRKLSIHELVIQQIPLLSDIQITSDYMSRWVVLKRRVRAVTSQKVLKVLFYVNILQCFFVVENVKNIVVF